MKGRFIFLGTGGSLGVPMVGCPCEVCKSDNEHNKRLRPSALVIMNDKKFLIDAGPDFRTQMLRQEVKTIDGVLFTHPHHDHTSGVDELRIFYIWNQHPLPTLLSEVTEEDIRRRYPYMFKEEGEHLTSKLDFQILKNDRGMVDFVGVPIRYLTYYQGKMPVNGFCFGNLAYISDIRQYPDTIFGDLRGIQTLVVSALRFAPSPLHFSVDEAVEFAKRVGAKQAWFTHIAHDLDHEKTNAYLPSNMRLAYDGLEIDFECQL
jgi:phosphoribosyl 1,2-cyclic phosphate phosphodiesterase